MVREQLAAQQCVPVPLVFVVEVELINLRAGHRRASATHDTPEH